MTKTRGKQAGLAITRRDVTDFFLAVFGFFVGRIVVFGDVSPLAAAYVSVFLGRGGNLYIAGLFALFGIFTRLPPFAALKYIIFVSEITLINALFGKTRVFGSGTARGVAAGISMTLAGLFMAFLGGNAVYKALIALLEGTLAFSLSIILHKSVRLTRRLSADTRLSNEEFVSAALLVCAFITGMADIYIGGVAIRYFLSAFIIILFACRGGAAVGAATGLTLGVLLNLTGFEGLEFAVVMAASGFCAGLVSDIHKLLCAGVFFVSGVLFAFLMSGRLPDTSYLLSAAFSCALFAAFPERYMAFLSAALRPTVGDSRIYADKVREIVDYKLNGLARAFERLGKSFASAGGETREGTSLSQKEVSALIEDAAASVCETCERYETCWNDNFYKTYQAAIGVLDSRENGEPTAFSGECLRGAAYAGALIRCYELRGNDLMWKRRLAESRELVSEQLTGVAGIINGLSAELNISSNFNEDAEKRLLDEFARTKTDVSGLSAAETVGGLEVMITHKPCAESRLCAKRIIPAVSKVLGRKMRREDEGCVKRRTKDGSLCVIKLSEERRFKLSAGISRAVKDGARESGDAALAVELKNGLYLMALSDGMGSGQKARDESETAIGLLESFLNSGFDKDVSIKMINSVLCLKSAGESFSTLDICLINLYTGEAEFVKIGAAPSFIARDGAVSAIQSYSLPAGILSNVELEVTKKRLNSGDVIVMVTDGLCCAADSENGGWLAERLSEPGRLSGSDMAEDILREAKARAKGAVRDDMTVLAGRVY